MKHYIRSYSVLNNQEISKRFIEIMCVLICLSKAAGDKWS